MAWSKTDGHYSRVFHLYFPRCEQVSATGHLSEDLERTKVENTIFLVYFRVNICILILSGISGGLIRKLGPLFRDDVFVEIVLE